MTLTRNVWIAEQEIFLERLSIPTVQDQGLTQAYRRQEPHQQTHNVRVYGFLTRVHRVDCKKTAVRQIINQYTMAKVDQGIFIQWYQMNQK